jgi:hypothetical protein
MLKSLSTRYHVNRCGMPQFGSPAEPKGPYGCSLGRSGHFDTSHVGMGNPPLWNPDFGLWRILNFKIRFSLKFFEVQKTIKNWLKMCSKCVKNVQKWDKMRKMYDRLGSILLYLNFACNMQVDTYMGDFQIPNLAIWIRRADPSGRIVYYSPLLNIYGLHCCMEIPCLTNCEAWRIFFYTCISWRIEQLASLALPICVPAGFLYFIWTYGFASAAVEAWHSSRQTDRQTDTKIKTKSSNVNSLSYIK